MSGFRNKNASDVTKNRNAYMANLALQEQINDMNLQANKTYLLSGQLPPSSQMQDTRTTSEKLKDVEGMKQQIAKDLYDIAEPQFAYAIVNKVLNSPLNVNNSLFRFLAQKAKQINEQLKPLYPYRIEGDMNDIEQIVSFIKNMYNNTQGSFQSVKSYINSVNGISSNSRVVSANDIDNIIIGIKDIIKNLEIGKLNLDTENRTGFPRTLFLIINDLQDKLIKLKNILPTTEQLNLFLSENEKDISSGTSGEFSEEMKSLFNFLENEMPKFQDVSSLIIKGKQYSKTKKYELLEKTLLSINNLFGFLSNIQQFNNILEDIGFIKNIGVRKENEIYRLQETQTLQAIKAQNQHEKDISKATKVYVMNDPLNVTSGGAPPNITIPFERREEGEGETKEDINDSIFRDVEGEPEEDVNESIFTDVEGEPEEDVNESIFRDVEGEPEEDIYESIFRDVEGEPRISRDELNRYLRERQILMERMRNEMDRYNQNRGRSGNGIKISKSSSVLKPETSKSSSVLKPEERVARRSNFIGFGVSEINKRSLDKNIVKIRRPSSKSNYMDLPSKRVSPHMKKIIERIVGGGMPEFDDLVKMDNDEKIYLNKLLEKADLKGRLSVPTPSKDQEEKDIHEFDLLKGQIMSGNDNKELVRRFKLLIRKLSRNQLLPRAEVNDMLDILSDLGY
jgi:hypothetical protein